jgi:hypothetical protein
LALRVAAHKGHETSAAAGLQSSSTDAGNEAGLGLDVLISSEAIHLQVCAMIQFNNHHLAEGV